MLRRMYTFICQASKYKDEPKRLIVLLRWLYLMMAACCIIFIASMRVELPKRIPCLGILSLIVVMIGFCFTYRIRMLKNLILYSFIMLFWIVSFVYLYGWDCGVQHLMFVVLVLVYFAVYDALFRKILLTVGLFFLRFGMFLYCRSHVPVVMLPDEMGVFLQILNSLMLFLALGLICGTYSSNIELAERKLVEYNEQLQMQAATDPLTGIRNRRAMQNYMQSYMQRNYKTLCTVALGDIDHFKKINDIYGHNCGDAVLIWLTGMFREMMEDKGVVCRWGGEEFLFFFHDRNGDDVYMILSGLKQQLNRQSFFWKGQEIPVTMTFGVEEYDCHSDITEIVEQVDKKLYQGKAEGRNRIIY